MAYKVNFYQEVTFQVISSLAPCLLLELERTNKRKTGFSRLTSRQIPALPELHVQVGQRQAQSKASNSLHSSDFCLIKSIFEFPEFEFQIKGVEFARGWYSHGFLLVFHEQMLRSKLIPKIYLKNNKNDICLKDTWKFRLSDTYFITKNNQ